MNKKVKVIIASILVVCGVTTTSVVITNTKDKEIENNQQVVESEVVVEKQEEQEVEANEEFVEETNIVEKVNEVEETIQSNESTTEIDIVDISNQEVCETFNEQVSENEVQVINGEEVHKSIDVNSNYINEIESEIIRLVNEERAKASVAGLQYNSTMEYYARIKSKDMGDNRYFDHADLNGQLMNTKMKNEGVSYNAWGENIAYIGSANTNSKELANEFMINWMNSDGHRKNILSTNFESIGVGVYKVGNVYYATQEFYK